MTERLDVPVDGGSLAVFRFGEPTERAIVAVHGITANSHKIIRNLIDAAIETAEKQSLNLHCCQKPAEMEDAQPRTIAKALVNLEQIHVD